MGKCHRNPNISERWQKRP